MNKYDLEVRVRYSETDQMGVVYYANYMVWFEMVRTEFFRNNGMSYRDLEKKDKIFLPVVEVSCKYKIPLKYDDKITVAAKLVEMGVSRIVFEYEIRRGDKLTTTGVTKHVFINEKGLPVRVPAKVRSKFQ